MNPIETNTRYFGAITNAIATFRHSYICDTCLAEDKHPHQCDKNIEYGSERQMKVNESLDLLTGVTHEILDVDRKARRIKDIQEEIEDKFRNNQYLYQGKNYKLDELFEETIIEETNPPNWARNMKPIEGHKVEPIYSSKITLLQGIEYRYLYFSIDADLALWFRLRDRPETKYKDIAKEMTNTIIKTYQSNVDSFKFEYVRAFDKKMSVETELQETKDFLKNSSYYNKLLIGRYAFIDENFEISLNDYKSKVEFVNLLLSHEYWKFATDFAKLKYYYFLEKKLEDLKNGKPISMDKKALKDNQHVINTPMHPDHLIDGMELYRDTLLILFKLMYDAKIFNPKIGKENLYKCISGLTGFSNNTIKNEFNLVLGRKIKEQQYEKLNTKLTLIINKLAKVLREP